MNIINCGGNCILKLEPNVKSIESILLLITKVPLLDTKNVEEMSNMFNRCSALTTIPLFDTKNVKDMSGMFVDCSALTTIPLLDTTNVEYMSSMFYGCSALTTIPLLDIKNAKDMSAMFVNCSALKNLNLVNWTQDDIDLSYSSKLTPLSVHNLISQAVGTEIRQLTLHADAWEAWVYSEYHDTDVDDAATKNIEIIEA